MADDPTPDQTAPAVDPTPEPQATDQPLGPEGEKALQAWKERARIAEKEAKRAAELEARLADIEAANMTEQEKALDQARKEAAEAARSEVLSTTNERLFAAEVRAAVAGKLNDPDLLSDPIVAQRLLGFDTPPVTDSGDIDAAAIAEKVASFLEAKPHLAASATQKPTSIDQGARTSTQTVKGLDEQIRDAEAEGDWKLAGSLKLQKLAAVGQP